MPHGKLRSQLARSDSYFRYREPADYPLSRTPTVRHREQPALRSNASDVAIFFRQGALLRAERTKRPTTI